MTNDKMDEDASSVKVKFSENKGLYIKNLFKSFGLMIWNGKQKRFINRDFKSWGMLGMFYGIFYIVIGAFFWAMLAILMAFVGMSGNRPTYTGLDSPLSSAAFVPGMGVKPYIGTTSKSIISFSKSDTASLVTNLNFLYSDYEAYLPNTKQCSDTGISNGSVACTFDLPTYLKELNCSKNESYGYPAGSPCVFLKLNNLFDWIPTSVSYPPVEWFVGCNGTNKINELKALTTSYIYVTCKPDQSNVNLTYNSPLGLDSCVGGIPFYYYPYTNLANYMQPLVIVKVNAPMGVDVSMVCNAWAGGINNDEKGGYGSVKFTVRIN